MRLKEEFTRYRLPEAEDWALYNIVTGDLYHVNDTVVAVLDLLDDGHDLEAISTQLAARFSEDPGVARSIVKETIDMLRECGALDEA